MRISDWSSDVCSSDLFFRQTLVRPPARGGRWAIAGRDRRQRQCREGDGLSLPRKAPAKWLIRRWEPPAPRRAWRAMRSEEHTSELQSLMRTSYAVFCLKKKNTHYRPTIVQ